MLRDRWERGYLVTERGRADISVVELVGGLYPQNLAARTLTLYPTKSCLDFLMDTAKFRPIGASASFFTGEVMLSAAECEGR